MTNLIVLTPVKNSLSTTIETIKSIREAKGDFSYFIFNDLSDQETEDYLTGHADELGYSVIHLKDHVATPSPNYRTTLIMGQQMAIAEKADLVIVESDVVIREDTLIGLQDYATKLDNAGLVGSVTVDADGSINFPYLHIPSDAHPVIQTKRSLSFCCTLLTHKFLASFDFAELSSSKDWYDVGISKKSRYLDFKNYVIKELPVLHRPHSSRPWKLQKYTNPFKYYMQKFFLRRDKI